VTAVVIVNTRSYEILLDIDVTTRTDVIAVDVRAVNIATA